MLNGKIDFFKVAKFLFLLSCYVVGRYLEEKSFQDPCWKCHLPVQKGVWNFHKPLIKVKKWGFQNMVIWGIKIFVRVKVRVQWKPLVSGTSLGFQKSRNVCFLCTIMKMSILTLFLGFFSWPPKEASFWNPNVRHSHACLHTLFDRNPQFWS